ncbi:MAG: hypothetical protein H6R15_670 [Proteobacteria bacterium]|nr:hypothetical protein [Pseudomonadota bacterium]
MSYILDALRKSEQERQIAAGRGVGMLYPGRLEDAPKYPWRAALLGGGALLAALLLLATAWSMWSTPAQRAAADRPVAAPTLIPAPPPGPAAGQAPARPSSANAMAQRPAAPTAKAARTEGAAGRAPAETASKKSGPPLAAAPPLLNAPPGSSKPESAGELPKGLPAINIAGYINDEQGANLAIINDKLVREGEEVAPGLRLEKIVGENAVFSYKGQRFRR